MLLLPGSFLFVHDNVSFTDKHGSSFCFYFISFFIHFKLLIVGKITTQEGGNIQVVTFKLKRKISQAKPHFDVVPLPFS